MPTSYSNTRGLLILGLCFTSLLATACAGGGSAPGAAQLPTLALASRHRSRPTSTPTQTPTPTPTSPATGKQARSSDAFVDFIGVNTHYFDGGSAYNSTSAVTALENLGVRHLRDQPGETSQDQIYKTLASHGVRFDMFWEPNYQNSRNPATYAVTTIGLSNFDSYEGENEQNGTCSGDAAWVSDITTQQSSLWHAMQVGGLSALPLMAPSYGNCGAWSSLIANADTMGTGVAPYSNYGNAHAYAGQIQPEMGSFVASQSSNSGSPTSYQGIALIEAPNKPVVVSEAGYGSDASENDLGVGIVGQERYTLRELLNFWNQGVAKAYIYALLDDPSGGGWGLMSDSYAAKPSYTALQNLIKTLADPGSAFSAGALSYALGGNVTNVNQVLLEKRNGTFEVILWQAVASENSSNGNALTVAPQTVTLTLPKAPSSIAAQTFTNAGALTSVTITQAGSVASMPVNDIPVIISIKP